MVMALRARAGLLALVVLAAAPDTSALAQQPDPARGIAAENAALTARIADDTSRLDRAAADLAQLRRRKDEVDAGMRRIEQSAEVHTLRGEFARTVTEQLHVLPKPRQFSATRHDRRRMLAATSDANLRTERSASGLADLDAAVASRLAAAQPPLPEADRPQAGAAMRKLLGEQRDLVSRLDALQLKLMRTLRDAGSAERDLERRSAAARADLNRLLFRIPVPPEPRTVSELAPSLAWTISPANWRAAGAVLLDDARHRPFWPTVAVLVVAGLYAGRRRLQRGLAALAPAAVTLGRYRIGHALAALAITLALAAPGPLLMWTAGTLLDSAPDTLPFARALGDALAKVAPLPLVLYTLAWLLDRRGVAVGHFGWNEASLAFAGQALRRFAALFVPLMFLTALNGLEHAPFANRESLARVALIVAMIVLAVFLVRLLRRSSPLTQRLFARAPRSWAAKLHPLWFAALVAVPIGIAALAVAGYFVAAGYFYGRMVYSLFLVLGALMLYGLIALWVHLQGTSLAGRQGQGAVQAAAPRLDIAAIGAETRSLLDLPITLMLLGGMWWVWADALPVLSVIGDYRLWTYTETVDGKDVSHPLTVASLFLAIVIGVVTAIAVRNVGALLDIVLLQRLEMQADATYAIKVVTRYALTAAGVVLASRNLGLGWSDVQWLVAALGVGLGFGLQEIFGNLVSGFIVLGERPIRIGDVVTVGDVTGTVSRIGARATTVIDFDNKEVLIPNKSLITDRVVNWTLSNQTTRLLLRIGVPHGTDVALAQRAMLEAVRRNPDVVREPAPSVYFTGIGGTSLDFEISAFVGSFDQRLRVQHELNLALDGALRDHGIQAPSGSTAGAGAHG